MHLDWTLRVPVVRLRLAAWLDAVVMVAATAAVLFAAYGLAAHGLVVPESVVYESVFRDSVTYDSAVHGFVVLSAPVFAILAAITVAGIAFFYAYAEGRDRRVVSAIRMDRDGSFHLRLRGGWQPAEWVGLWRGPRWLTLRVRLPAGLCNAQAGVARHITFTVWQDRLPAPAWRRICLFANRRLCRDPAARAAGIS